MKIGLISFAHMHAFSYAAHLLDSEEVELAYIWDDNVQRGKDNAKKYNCTFYSDLDDFLNTDMKAVIICSENTKHYEYVTRSAKAGKHILCEKPIATSIKDAQEMIGICEEEEVIFQIAYPVRFAPVVRRAKVLINDGVIGDILAISGKNRGKMPGGWFVDKEKSGGGAAVDHIVHLLDLIRWTLNDGVKSVYAELDTRFHDIDVEDCGMVSLELESGIIASIDPSWSRPQTFPNWGDVILKFVGTKGNLTIDVFKEHSIYYNDTAEKIQQLEWSENMDKGLIEDFIACVREGRKPSITGNDGLKTLEVVMAAYESNEKKEKVLL